MDIKRKADGAVVRGVTESRYFETYGWVKESPDCTTYYHKDHWEPVEEWVTIRVRKSQWDNVDKSCGMMEVRMMPNEHSNYGTLSWRTPQ